MIAHDGDRIGRNDNRKICECRPRAARTARNRRRHAANAAGIIKCSIIDENFIVAGNQRKRKVITHQIGRDRSGQRRKEIVGYIIVIFQGLFNAGLRGRNANIFIHRIERIPAAVYADGAFINDEESGAGRRGDPGICYAHAAVGRQNAARHYVAQVSL